MLGAPIARFMAAMRDSSIVKTLSMNQACVDVI